MLCFCSVITKTACPGRIRLDDAIRYENKREIDILCKSRSYLRGGGDLVLSKARQSRRQEFKEGWVG